MSLRGRSCSLPEAISSFTGNYFVRGDCFVAKIKSAPRNDVITLLLWMRREKVPNDLRGRNGLGWLVTTWASGSVTARPGVSAADNGVKFNGGPVGTTCVYIVLNVFKRFCLRRL